MRRRGGERQLDRGGLDASTEGYAIEIGQKPPGTSKAPAPLKRIVIVGGGTAGWMTAALFSNLMKGRYSIRLIESEEIGTIGVGEATIPSIKKFNSLLGLDENEFIRATQGTFKLGIQFNDWTHFGDSYVHGFGKIGQDWEWLRCHQYWLKAHKKGVAADFGRYSLNAAASLQNKFMRSLPDRPDSPLGDIAYAFHFDAGLYAKFLRSYAEQRGAVRIEGRVVDVARDGESGDLLSVTLAGGEVVAGDFFIDCSGFHALLIEKTLQSGWQDWSAFLPCDRAIAVPCERSADFASYTRATARAAGWQWRIPLQHRTGNGHVYSSAFMEDAEAEAILLANLDGEPRADPLKIKFRGGKRRKIWHHNCVAIGLASGFVEPLESTALFMIQSAVVRLIGLFPDSSFAAVNRDEFNRQCDFEWERIRDFIILHYIATTREDTPFWRYVRQMELPDTLKHKIDLFRANGRVFRENDELFGEESWIQVFIGQGIIPDNYDPLVDLKSDAQIREYLKNIETVIERCVTVMPGHADFVAKFCRAA